MHLLLIINPHASRVASGSPEALSTDCGTCLQGWEEPVTHEILVPETPEHLRQRLEELLSTGGIDRVVICGGDGTISETLPVMIRHPQIPLALLPVGTGNLLAANLGIPTALEDALRVAAQGRLQALDVARMNGTVFILNASVGIDAEIMDQTDHDLKKRWGPLAYFIRGLPLLRRQPQARFHIKVDETVLHTRAVGATIFNAGSMITPNGLTLLPVTQPDDGRLDGVLFRSRNWTDYLLGLAQLILPIDFKKHAIVRQFSGRRIEITCTPPLKTQVDGNVIGETPVTLEVFPLQLQICVP